MRRCVTAALAVWLGGLGACGKDGSPAGPRADAAPAEPAWAKGLATSTAKLAPLGKDVKVVMIGEAPGTAPAPDTPLAIAARADASYRELFATMADATKAGWRPALAVRTATGFGLVDIVVPSIGELGLVPLIGDKDGDAARGRRAPGADLQRQLDEVKGSGVVSVAPRGGGGRAGADMLLGEPVGADARVTVGAMKALGGDEDYAVLVDRKVRMAYLPMLKRCHREALKRDPGAHGGLGVELTVGAAGAVTAVKGTISDGLPDEVRACVEAAVQRWRFDRQEEPLTVRFALTFTGGAGAAPRAPDPPGAAHAPDAAVADVDPGLLLMVAADRVVLLSRTGTEGTMAQPAWQGDAAGEGLDRKLAEIKARHWADRPAPPLMVAGADGLPVQRLVDALDVAGRHFGISLAGALR